MIQPEIRFGRPGSMSRKTILCGYHILASERNVCMHVIVTLVPQSEEERADIRVHEIRRETELAASLLEDHRNTLIGTLNGERCLLNPDDIYYFEAVDDRTFACTEKHTYELNKRLYELESQLDAHFFRSSKSQLVNISRIASVRSEMNGRMTASLLNGEKLVVSRSYVKELKRRLGL